MSQSTTQSGSGLWTHTHYYFGGKNALRTFIYENIKTLHLNSYDAMDSASGNDEEKPGKAPYAEDSSEQSPQADESRDASEMMISNAPDTVNEKMNIEASQERRSATDGGNGAAAASVEQPFDQTIRLTQANNPLPPPTATNLLPNPIATQLSSLSRTQGTVTTQYFLGGASLQGGPLLGQLQHLTSLAHPNQDMVARFISQGSLRVAAPSSVSSSLQQQQASVLGQLLAASQLNQQQGCLTPASTQTASSLANAYLLQLQQLSALQPQQPSSTLLTPIATTQYQTQTQAQPSLLTLATQGNMTANQIGALLSSQQANSGLSNNINPPMSQPSSTNPIVQLLLQSMAANPYANANTNQNPSTVPTAAAAAAAAAAAVVSPASASLSPGNSNNTVGNSLFVSPQVAMQMQGGLGGAAAQSKGLSKRWMSRYEELVGFRHVRASRCASTKQFFTLFF